MKLELNVNEINAILTALGQMPYAQVFGLGAKIRQQATEQMEQKDG